MYDSRVRLLQSIL